MGFRHLLRKWTLRCLPEPVLQGVKKIRYGRELAGPWEASEPDTRVVRHLVPSGGTVLDLGANFGKYTKLLSGLVGPSGRVFSVEPMPPTYDLLTANVRRFGLTNVTTINAAVTECDGEVRMEVPHYPSGGENFYEARIVAGGPAARGLRHALVPGRSLDSLFGAYRGCIDFIKCDVEDHEWSCLQGAGDLLAAGRPAWLIEVSGKLDDPTSRAGQLLTLLAAHGYEAFSFDGRVVRPWQPDYRSTNYFFLTPSHLAQLPEPFLSPCIEV